jgi:cbb3-type cytochrome oxidase subunit 3
MKLLPLIAIIFVLSLFLLSLLAYLLDRWAKKQIQQEPENGTEIDYSEMFAENDIEEHSPENIEFEKALATALLKQKLQKIELKRKSKETRMKDINLDYQNEEGK